MTAHIRCIWPSSAAVPLQFLHVGAVFRKDPDPPAVRRPSMQVKSQVIHLIWLAAGEAGHLTGSWDRSKVVDPKEVPDLKGHKKTFNKDKIKNILLVRLKATRQRNYSVWSRTIKYLVFFYLLDVLTSSPLASNFEGICSYMCVKSVFLLM